MPDMEAMFVCKTQRWYQIDFALEAMEAMFVCKNQRWYQVDLAFAVHQYSCFVPSTNYLVHAMNCYIVVNINYEIIKH
jgi:hypothetical protein